MNKKWLIFILTAQACAKKSIEKKYNEVLQRQGIDADEIENIWKQLNKSNDIGRSCESDDYEPAEQLEMISTHQVDEYLSDHSEHDLAESVSINLSPVKEL